MCPENGPAVLCLHDQKIQCPGDGGKGQFAAQHGLHLFQAVQVRNLLAPGDTRTGTAVQLHKDFTLLCKPVFKVVGWGHGISFKEVEKYN